ncbi:MAG: triphosphoribosyl-dephospho-CoA synthase [Terrimicrobiaceae bacterium]
MHFKDLLRGSGGVSGGLFAQQRAQAWLDAGGIASPRGREFALEIHREFVARNLSPGGAADLLAGTIFLHHVTARTSVTRSGERKSG